MQPDSKPTVLTPERDYPLLQAIRSNIQMTSLRRGHLFYGEEG